MKTIIKILFVLSIILILAPFVAFKYFLGSGPRDLGIKYSVADYTATHDKFGVSVSTLDSADSVKNSLKYSGRKDIKIAVNSVELTSYVNAETWKYSPFSNLQIKINADNTGEVSGVLNLSNILPFISMTTPVEEVNKAIEKFHISGNPPFYAKGNVTVTNNRVNFQVNSLEIGRIPVPASYIADNLAALNNFVDDRLKAVPNLMVRSLSMDNGQVKIDATVPETISKLKK